MFHQELAKETAEAKAAMEEQRVADQVQKDGKDTIIQKLRTLAKKYKGESVARVYNKNNR